MLIATIYVDDQVYGGIDYNASDDTNPSPAFRAGFHNYNHHGGRDVLMWGGEPKLVEGRRNLSSRLARILDRIDDGTLTAKTIRIELAES